MRLRPILLLVAVVLALGHLRAQQRASDPLAPRSDPATAEIGPLHTVTISTGDANAYQRLFVTGLGLRMRGPWRPDDTSRAVQRALWGLPASATWTMYLLDRPTAPGAVQIRLLVFDTPGPEIRATWNPLEPGPLTLGFPVRHLPAVDATLRALGYESLAPMEQSRIPRPDGTTYGLQETIFRGPDKVHVVLVSRLDDMPQLGPVDPDTGVGGPAYSAEVVTDSDALVAFYRHQLGLELRSDREWRSGERGALGIPGGTPFRLALMYAPGATSGQLLLMDFRERSAPASGVAPRPPNRGICIYTFAVRDLERAAARLAAAGHALVGGPADCDGEDLGPRRALTVRSPTGLLVELFAPRPRRP